ncbi:peptidoglycan-binding domain-containing protein [Nannocystis radixulma]|uniref:Peptidoglycan-binding domain-containing protein n=1 Tax=Nannocystis radixulma TaxID=2995305 RepID=A0ABT5AWM5_9BACT|nr:peptidoglycan-binding domain-containing protein [Nannocystis radixulma]MDC0666221.1 peptidoglycan-binding domain-containing protein [Nannocystis radixulma]
MVSGERGMGGRTIIIQPGDTMVSIAHAHGYRRWENIYRHPHNAELRGRCPNPAVLQPGATLFLPEKGTGAFTGEVDRRHKFRVKALKAWLRFTVGDQERVFAGARYRVTVAGGDHEGTTGPDGLIALQVPPDARSARVTVWLGGDEQIEWNVRIGHLDPPGSRAGVRSRLANLGYDVDETDERLARAVAAFQHDHDLPPSGELDAPTTARLLAVHGG